MRIEVARPATTAKTITQLFRFCPDGEDWAKREVLRELIRSEDVKNAIIFCNRKRDVAILLKSLQKHGFNAGALHGDMEQSQRTATLDAFRAGTISLLAASDVAARGLDIPEVSHVFNFDVPWAGDDYVHRIGRTGRAGREGRALSLVSPDDLRLLKDIEKVTGETPSWIGDVPTEEDFASSSKKRRRGRGGGKGDERRGGRDRDRRADRGPGHGRDGDRPPRPIRTAPAQPASEAPRPADAEAPAGRPRGEHQPAAERREGRPPRRDRPPHRERAQPRAASTDQPDVPMWPVTNLDEQVRPPRKHRDRPEHGREQQAERPSRGDEQRPQHDRQQSGRDRRPQRAEREDRGGPTGFADNIPAFLRKPVKAKAASD